eukprot:502317-Amphidinium_carterae.1
MECTPEAVGALPSELGTARSGSSKQSDSQPVLATPAKTKFELAQPVGHLVDETKLELPSPDK